MHFNDYQLSNNQENKKNSKKSIFSSAFNGTTLTRTSIDFIRFEIKKEQYIWAHPDEICFVKSADHYVKSLIKYGNQLIWMTRHSTIKELLDILPEVNFIRLNRFYVLNLNYFSHFNDSEKLLYLNQDFSISIPHRISPFLRHLLKTTHT